MLKHLYIRNYALIEELNLDLQSGFSVITGETGAGKSILLGAIGLLLGQRTDTKCIQQNAQRCVVEATFDLTEYDLEPFFIENELEYDKSDCIIRREVTEAGKSRAFINDTPCNLTLLKQLGSRLIDVHSQHQNLLLGDEDFQLQVLDILSRNAKEKETYLQSYQQWKDAVRRLKEAQEEADQDKEDFDFIQFQLQQLQALNPQVGEDEALQEESNTLSHAEEIKTSLFQADQWMHEDESGVIHQLRRILQTMQNLCRIYNDVLPLSNRLESSFIEIKDIAAEISDKMDIVEVNPQRLQAIEERLDALYNLEQKHHVQNAAELIQIRQDLEKKTQNISNSDEYIAQLTKEVNERECEMKKNAKLLTKRRTEAITILQQEMVTRLIPLGIPNAQFSVSIEPREIPHPDGMDRITFLFSANKNGTLQPISQVASGGEISRIMLSLKALTSSCVHLPTLIFDEIDTGVSGRIAECMAQMMCEMGKYNRQIICITHLPQIASKGNWHYLVYKEDTDSQTLSHIRPLNDDERIMEIAHMLSGTNVTQAALENAKQLLKS